MPLTTSPRLSDSVELPSTPNRRPSPLNPSSSSSSSNPATPTASSIPLPSPDVQSPPIRGRARSPFSATLPDRPSFPTSSSSLTITSQSNSTISTATIRNGASRSLFRSRSPSPGRVDSAVWTKRVHDTNLMSSWWGGEETPAPRPWKEPDAHEKEKAPSDRKESVPMEQAEAYDRTRQRIKDALGLVADITYEALKTGSAFLSFAPIPGLQIAAETLLHIWDAASQVDNNRCACLRLTERCADILISVRQEIEDAGESVARELKDPMQKLIEAFQKVLNLLAKQGHRPFLKRYLKRDEILGQISGCDSALKEALAMFGLSIQLRILKEVQAADARRKADNQVLLDAFKDVLHGFDPRFSSPNTPHAQLPPLDTIPLQPPLNPTNGAPATAIEAIQTIHHAQDSLDARNDMRDLKQLMSAAVRTNNDAEMIKILQVAVHEMPEAIKTLQRALEREMEKDLDAYITIPGVGSGGDLGAVGVDGSGLDGAAGAGMGGFAMRVMESPVVDMSLRRSDTFDSDGASSTEDGGRGKDVSDKEFIESGIDALRRMSQGADASLPSWTITRFEVDREGSIGFGFFSDVFKGTWQGREVAIKVLAETTPRELFINEVEIWKSLHHPNVLRLYGASSTTGPPPWFFVSPYEKNGNLAKYLTTTASNEAWSTRDRTTSLPSWRLGDGSLMNMRGRGETGGILYAVREAAKMKEALRYMHEIAKGMQYLHENGVLHGDLKASNVLVDDRLHCVINDFGQSEMKSAALRISGVTIPHGTLRWQAPELIDGTSPLTAEMDVYAFAVCCVEILMDGRVPWALLDDNNVRHLVIVDNSRPPIPPKASSALRDLISKCWDRDPKLRPTFVQITAELKHMRRNTGQTEDGPPPRFPEPDFNVVSRPSPDLRPISLPEDSGPKDVTTSDSDSFVAVSTEGSFKTARDTPSPTHTMLSTHSHQEATVGTTVNLPEAVLYTPSEPAVSRSASVSSSFNSLSSPAPSEDHIGVFSDDDGYESPPSQDERANQIRDERRYRLLLSHEFHPSLTLPLWEPSPVEIGAIGFLSRPSGKFITLFNALNPKRSGDSSTKNIPSIRSYGPVRFGHHKQDKRSAAQRGLDAFVGFLTFKNRGDGHISQSVSRRHSFPLRMGHKTAYLCTESTTYSYMEVLDAPKAWFKANAAAILETFRSRYAIQKEDLFLVIGTLTAAEWGLFVSHSHPDGQVHFNIFSSPRNGQPWGAFTTDTASDIGWPSYKESVSVKSVSSSKVSLVGGPSDTLMIAKLRFKPDGSEPTSL